MNSGAVLVSSSANLAVTTTFYWGGGSIMGSDIFPGRITLAGSTYLTNSILVKNVTLSNFGTFSIQTPSITLTNAEIRNENSIQYFKFANNSWENSL